MEEEEERSSVPPEAQTTLQSCEKEYVGEGQKVNTEDRLMISKIVCENFKSYAGIKELGPFHKVSLAVAVMSTPPHWMWQCVYLQGGYMMMCLVMQMASLNTDKKKCMTTMKWFSLCWGVLAHIMFS